MVCETEIGRESVKVRMKGMNLVDCINSMKDSVSIILVNEERIIGIYSDAL